EGDQRAGERAGEGAWRIRHLRHARRESDSGNGRPRAVPGRRAVPGGNTRRGAALGGVVIHVRHPGRGHSQPRSRRGARCPRGLRGARPPRTPPARPEAAAVTPDFWSTLFDFSDYGELLFLVRNSIIAGAI